MANRTPYVPQENPRDLNGNKEDTVKGALHKLMSTPGKGNRSLRLRDGIEPVSLKRLARFLAANPDTPKDQTVLEMYRRVGGCPELSLSAKRWLSNKAGNPSKPSLGIGSTRKKKGKGDSK